MTKATESKLLQDVATIKQAIMGNGVKGLAERMCDIETWIGTHPRLCPIEKKGRDVFKIRALEISLMALILTAAQILLRIVKIL